MFRFVMRAVMIAAVVQGSAFGQGPFVGPVSAADSSRLVRAVRSAQAGFEAFRRNRLPIERSGGTAVCDARIGRYCYWRGDDDRDTTPPEPPAIGDRRATLLALLDTAAHALGGDAWIAGQNVRYLVEAKRTDDAVAFARGDCRASKSWCAALAGYAAHTGARFAAADSEFANALAAMDLAERTRWLDIEKLTAGPLRDRYGALRADEREPFARRVLWLSTPLFSVTATDLLTEHFARLTRARIAEHAATTYGDFWADDARDLVLRYGWPTWYSRSLPDYGSMREPSITGHDPGMPYNYFPSLRVVDHVGRTASDDWNLDDRRAPTGYAPAYARSMHDLPHQIALFRRGESTLVVAAWDARRDTTLLGRDLDAALVLASDPQHTTIARRENARATGRISTIGVIDSGLVSLEVLAKADRRAARARVGVPGRIDGALALSDLLLYSPTDAPPYSLDVVRDSAMASDVFPQSGAAGVYWETYGLPADGAPVHFSITIEQVNVSLLRQVAEKLRFADPTRALRIQWDEVPQRTNGVAGRGVRVDVSQLRSGRYRMQLTVEGAVGLSAVTAREIEVR